MTLEKQIRWFFSEVTTNTIFFRPLSQIISLFIGSNSCASVALISHLCLPTSYSFFSGWWNFSIDDGWLFNVLNSVPNNPFHWWLMSSRPTLMEPWLWEIVNSPVKVKISRGCRNAVIFRFPILLWYDSFRTNDARQESPWKSNK